MNRLSLKGFQAAWRGLIREIVRTYKSHCNRSNTSMLLTECFRYTISARGRGALDRTMLSIREQTLEVFFSDQVIDCSLH